MSAQLLSRFTGCLLGLAAGDCLGASVEGWTAEDIRRRYGRLTDIVGSAYWAAGEHTDDTAMMLCIAHSLAERGHFDPEDVADRFLQWYRAGAKGIGMTTRMALAALDRGASWEAAGRLAHQVTQPYSAGNGTVMRCAPIGLFFHLRPDDLVRASLESAAITHPDPLATWGAAALNLTIAALLTSDSKEAARSAWRSVQEPTVRQALEGVERLSESALAPLGFVLHTLECAFWCFLRTESLEEAVVTAVNLGGDTDTIGAITGALAGAHYGVEAVPARWREAILAREEIEGVARALFEAAPTSSARRR